jgi:hypothetical protein
MNRHLAAAVLCLASASSHARTTAYTLDLNGARDLSDIYLAFTLQGLVNRDAPRLFISNLEMDRGSGCNAVYQEYLHARKGFDFVRLPSLNAAIALFARQTRANGQPLLKGLVKYPTPGYLCWIAGNFAAQEDLLPVTPAHLANATPLLNGSDLWRSDTQMRGWGDMFAAGKPTAAGLEVTQRTPHGYVYREVALDLAVTPKLEVVVSALSPGGSWNVALEMGSVHGVARPRELTGVTTAGTVTVDLQASGLFRPTAGRARVMLSPGGLGSAVTFKSLRFLGPDGREPATPPSAPPKDEFAALRVVRDLADAAAWPQLTKVETATAWSLANQRAGADRSSFCSANDGQGGWWVLPCLDYVVAHKSYLYFSGAKLFPGGGHAYDAILKDLTPPALVHGWIGDEHYSCMKLGQYGASYSGGPAENFSFWQHVPLDDPARPPLPVPARQVTKLEDKCYVNFGWASGDAIPITYRLMDNYWHDPARGQVPMTWGFDAEQAAMAPALAEFYGQSATPNDSFWAGPSGGGYTHPGVMPPDRLALYAERARRNIAALGLSRAVDYWDAHYQLALPKRLGAFTRDTAEAPPVELLALLPNGAAGRALNAWLADGTPVVQLDRLLFSKWGGDGQTTPESLAAGVQAAAAKHPKGAPLLLTSNIRFAPTFLKRVRDLLPPERFTVVGMQDFIGLAQDAGGLTVEPFAAGVGAGDSLKMAIALHNASGRTGEPGTVTWTLPPGWSAVPERWTHGPVAKGGRLRQVVTFTPPRDLAAGQASFLFSDTRFAWHREVVVATYSGGRTVTDGDSAAGWTAAAGATVALADGLLTITPREPLTEADAAEGRRVADNGRVSHPLGEVDCDREPVLLLTIPEQLSVATQVSVTDAAGRVQRLGRFDQPGSYTLDLRALTKWSGKHQPTLTIEPATSFGSFLRLQCVKLCWRR